MSTRLLVILCIFVFGALSMSPKTCDDFRECARRKLTINRSPDMDVVKCFGSYGCTKSRIKADEKVLCLGDHSCSKSRISTSGDVYCNGFKSCEHSRKILSTDNAIACNGAFSCSSIGKKKGGPVKLIANIGSVECNGVGTCKGNRIRSGKTTFCDGARACTGTVINSALNVECDGDMSCQGAVVSANSNVHCYGKKVCMGSTIRGYKIHVYGYFGASYSTILNAASVRVMGFNGLAFGEIDSHDQLTMVVSAYGYRALFKAHIYCRAGAQCTLFCGGNACKTAYFGCEVGATCNVQPDACQDQNNQAFVKKHNGVYCPVWETGVANVENAADLWSENLIFDDEELKLMKLLNEDDMMDVEYNKMLLQEQVLNDEMELEYEQLYGMDDDEEEDEEEIIAQDLEFFGEDNDELLLFGDNGLFKPIDSASQIYPHLITIFMSGLSTFVMVGAYYKIKYKDDVAKF